MSSRSARSFIQPVLKAVCPVSFLIHFGFVQKLTSLKTGHRIVEKGLIKFEYLKGSCEKLTKDNEVHMREKSSLVFQNIYFYDPIKISIY